MLTVSNLSKSFGDRSLFEGVSFSVNPRDRIGLIGVNGSGKSTLLALIARQLPASSGSIWLEPGATIGYLRQGFADRADADLAALLDDATGGLIDASTRVDRALAALADSTDSEALREYDDALAALEAIGGYQRLAELDALLGKLNVDHLDWETPLSQLSGGEKTRAGLAGLLVKQPSLLLLDEPTNHLDAQALDWLEGFVAAYPGAIVMVSHDRAFLDATVTEILELDPKYGRVTPYPGNYSDYLSAKQAARLEQAESYQRQQAEIERIQRDVRAVASHAMATEKATQNDYLRGRSKKVARTAVVRERKLEKLLASEEMVERPEREWGLALDFAGPPSAARDVVSFAGVSISLGGRPILDHVDLHVKAGERIALTGPNGSGKSTLLRLIAGPLTPDAGVVRIGSGVQIGVHAQEQETVDLHRSAVEQARAVSNLSETEVRTFLHRFLFSGDLALSPARDLSYGERSRLALALLVIQGANLLLLDEPLNHLDLDSREQFELALQRYEGTAIIVLHDRRAIELVATRTLAIENGRLVEHDSPVVHRR
jgi:ATP-binding cassette subfamily F protein 3